MGIPRRAGPSRPRPGCLAAAQTAHPPLTARARARHPARPHPLRRRAPGPAPVRPRRRAGGRHPGAGRQVRHPGGRRSRGRLLCPGARQAQREEARRGGGHAPARRPLRWPPVAGGWRLGGLRARGGGRVGQRTERVGRCRQVADGRRLLRDPQGRHPARREVRARGDLAGRASRRERERGLRGAAPRVLRSRAQPLGASHGRCGARGGRARCRGRGRRPGRRPQAGAPWLQGVARRAPCPTPATHRLRRQRGGGQRVRAPIARVRLRLPGHRGDVPLHQGRRHGYGCAGGARPKGVRLAARWFPRRHRAARGLRYDGWGRQRGDA